MTKAEICYWISKGWFVGKVVIQKDYKDKYPKVLHHSCFLKVKKNVLYGIYNPQFTLTDLNIGRKKPRKFDFIVLCEHIQKIE